MAPDAVVGSYEIKVFAVWAFPRIIILTMGLRRRPIHRVLNSGPVLPLIPGAMFCIRWMRGASSPSTSWFSGASARVACLRVPGGTLGFLTSHYFVIRSMAWVQSAASTGKTSLSASDCRLRPFITPDFWNFVLSCGHCCGRILTKFKFFKKFLSRFNPLVSCCPTPELILVVMVIKQILPLVNNIKCSLKLL